MTIMPKFIKENNDLLLSLNLSKEETFTGYYDIYGKKYIEKLSSLEIKAFKKV